MTSLKETFVEYYPLSTEESEDIMKRGIIVFDTNALLELYRCSEETQETLLEVLEYYEERLWLPFHVGKEFLKNRVKIIKSQEKYFNDFKSDVSLDGVIKKANTARNKHVAIKTEEIISILNEANEKIKENLRVLESNSVDYLKDDDILMKLNELFKDKVGDSYSESELNNVEAKAKVRYENKIPPGYEDEGKDSNQYGDCIIWLQMIEYIRDKKVPLVFVTRDKKEDWFELYNKQPIGPRTELLREFYNETNQKCLIYSLGFFLSKTNIKGKNQDSISSAISEINNISIKIEPEIELKSSSAYYEKVLLEYGCTVEDVIKSVYSFKLRGRRLFTTMDVVRAIRGGRYISSEHINQVVDAVLYSVRTDLFEIYPSECKRKERDDIGLPTSVTVWGFRDELEVESIYIGDSDGKGNYFCYRCMSYNPFSGTRCTNCGSHSRD